MRLSETGSVNWTAVAALAAALAALAATLTSVSLLWYVRVEGQQARMRAGLESLWHFTSQWEMADLGEARSLAVNALLSGTPTRDVESVLDFFDEVALLANRGILDEELVWYEFYWPMANYWRASQEYVRDVQGDDPNAWSELGNLMPRLTVIEARRRRVSVHEAGPTKLQVREFMLAEVGSGTCAEPDVDEKVPLRHRVLALHRRGHAFALACGQR
jgi:hypothetical protein